MQKPAIVLPYEIGLLLSVQHVLKCQDDVDVILAAAFDWYYVPRSIERRAYAARVVEEALRNYYQPGGTLPDWFVRVYELLCEGGPSTTESVPPPPDPANKR